MAKKSFPRLITNRQLDLTVVGFVLASVAVGFYIVTRLFAASVVSSKQSGVWSAATTWSSGRVPIAGDKVVISPSHAITYDLTSNATARPSKITVNGQLTFQSDKSTQLESTGNVVVTGALTMKPANATIVHNLKFINVNETKFVGGGMDVLDSDVGLWVMGVGKLNALGAQRLGWSRATGGITAGAPIRSDLN